ncbi:uncharacterized protein BYT42DRAFT_494806 [Radiomyces spectabilis]|uniref:uncharacterized protein n=1 Tax=Radiomyces spectabilis TaxID=64574 RepID=UPI0022210FCE|nr:uncharacterized protein BYT42DRAFT_494806 [Radiomyces spectabilis]KAI8380902.1 hypothetical protein BYT42DRAFT_494806 [Radiomyces spectabilis]
MKRGFATKSESKKKRTKTYHCAKEQYNKGKGAFAIQTDMSGVLVMCARGKEGRAVKEALDVFQDYANVLYPAETTADTNEDEEDDDDDIEASIAKEVAAMKAPKQKKRFANISTNTGCLAFIRTLPPIEPVQFVHSILTDINEKQIQKTRYISRFLPVEKTCQSNLPEIERVGAQVIKPKFDTVDDAGNPIVKTFAIVARIRNCTKLDRAQVIQTLASVVGSPHKVDLENPEYTIIVEVCQVSKRGEKG